MAVGGGERERGRGWVFQTTHHQFDGRVCVRVQTYFVCLVRYLVLRKYFVSLQKKYEAREYIIFVYYMCEGTAVYTPYNITREY